MEVSRPAEDCLRAVAQEWKGGLTEGRCPVAVRTWAA